MTKRLTICACRCRNLVPADSVAGWVERAKTEGCEVEVVDDLCSLIQDADDETLSRLQGGVVAACHERAVKSLLAWRGIEAKELINLRKEPQQEMADTTPLHPQADAWFPVIDKDRCTECGKCFDFCPFGVYDMVDDRVRVVHPASCKNNCPACARNCPSEAIIFPKYERSPINGGTERDERAVRVDHSSLYADAIRQRLIERRKLGTTLYRMRNEK